MVFGFGSKSKKRSVTNESPAALHTSPSLPEMYTGGIPWPEDLVDVAAIRSTPPPDYPPPGPAKLSFSSPSRTPSGAIPFHRPFRVSSPESTNGTAVSSRNEHTSGFNAPIASLFTSGPPSAFHSAHARAGTFPPSSLHGNKTRTVQRKGRIAPAFNLMVCVPILVLVCVFPTQGSEIYPLCLFFCK